MKPLFIISTYLIMSTAAFAECPNISGSFFCQKGSHVSNKTIIKNDQNFLIISDGVEFEYLTDGVTYDVPSTENMSNAKVKSSCKEDKLIIDFSASIMYDGSVIAKQVSKSEYSMKGDKLLFIQKNKMKGLPMPTLTFECSRSE